MCAVACVFLHMVTITLPSEFLPLMSFWCKMLSASRLKEGVSHPSAGFDTIVSRNSLSCRERHPFYQCQVWHMPLTQRDAPCIMAGIGWNGQSQRDSSSRQCCLSTGEKQK